MIKWISTTDLLYNDTTPQQQPQNNNNQIINNTNNHLEMTTCCAHCRKSTTTLHHCKRCSTTYCSEQCYTKDWTSKPHRMECKWIETFIVQKIPLTRPYHASNEIIMNQILQIIEQKLLLTITYLSAYVASHFKMKGREGLLFLQCNSSLEQLVFVGTVDWKGQPLTRQFHITFLTLEEWDSLLIERNFELGHEASKTVHAVRTCTLDEMVVCLLLKCGLLVTGIVTMSPKLQAAERLGNLYEFDKKEELILDIDSRDDTE
jgi:hypothetical protein